MSRSLLEALPELVEAGILPPEAAERIRDYYAQKPSPAPQRQMILFGILGALLVGLGVILVVAHNWDSLPKAAQAFFAFLPLAIAHALAFYAQLRQGGSMAWRESTALLVFFATGACIALIAQVYQIPGDLGPYLLTWTLLSLPLLYATRSASVSLLCIVGAAWYGCETGYFNRYDGHEPLYALGLLAAQLPFYAWLTRQAPRSNFTAFHHCLLPLALIVLLGTLAQDAIVWLWPAYMSLMGFLYLAGSQPDFRPAPAANGYRLLGSLGTVILLLILSYDEPWGGVAEAFAEQGNPSGREFWAALLLTVGAIALFIRQGNFEQQLREPDAFTWVFLPFLPLLKLEPFFAAVICNLLLLAAALSTIAEGSRRDNLARLNYGLLILMALVVARFFDQDISFIVRGLLFAAAGVGFFIANYRLLRKRKAASSENS
jgi:uncharacterized membrane protein